MHMQYILKSLKSFSSHLLPLLLIMFVVTFFLLHLPRAQAAGTPSIVSYQGRLLDSSGNLLGGSGTTFYFKFSIWDASATTSGSRLWPSAAPTAFTKTVREGVFNVNIGDTDNGYPDLLDYNFNTNKNIYLQVEVSDDNVTFQTMSPRHRIGSTPFAELSGAVSGTSTPSSFGTTTPIANTLVTIEATSTDIIPLTIRAFVGQVANLFQIQNSAGASLFSVNASGQASTTSFLVSGTATSTFGGATIDGSGAANRVTFWTDGDSLSYDDAFVWDNTNKRLGIGTTSPSTQLTVQGTTTSDIFNAGTTTTNAGYYQYGQRILFGATSTDFTNPALAASGRNLFVGFGAGTSTVPTVTGGGTGYSNTFAGFWAGQANTTGNSNSAFGTLALAANTTASGNSAFGASALAVNKIGTDNSAFGYNVLAVNTTGDYNAAFGSLALDSNTTGDYNAAFGYNVLTANTTGDSNSAFGYSTLDLNTTGSYNSAFGYSTLDSNTTGDFNSAFGYTALSENTLGKNNSAFGYRALYSNRTGSSSVAIGTEAGYGVTNNSFSSSTLVGYRSGYGLTTGSRNVLLGFRAGDAITSGQGNLIFGYDIDAPSATDNNQLNIGNLIFGTNLDGTGSTLSTGNIGLGTTTPNWTLQVASVTPYISITDTDATTDNKHYLLSNIGGIFRIGTSSDSLSSTSTLLSMDTNGVNGTTTFAQSIRVQGTGTSTSANGFDISAGCFSINGVCVGGATIDGSGAANRVTFWTDGDSLSYDDAFVWDNTNKRLGIGTTSPYTAFAVAGTVVADNFIGTSTTATSTFTGTVGIGTSTPFGNNPWFVIGSSTPTFYVDKITGNIGLGTTTPRSKLEVNFGTLTSPSSYASRGIITGYYGSSNFRKGTVYMVAEGTVSAPAVVTTSTFQPNAVTQFYDGSTWRTGAEVSVAVTGVSANTSVTSELRFFTGTATGDGGAGSSAGLAQNMTLNANGNLGLG